MVSDKLKNKHILITGASSGIGREVAIMCAQMGAQVTMIARNQKNLELVLELLEGEKHGYFLADLSKIEEISSLIFKIIGEKGTIDGFVHCAGMESARPLKYLKPEYAKNVMDINFFSYLELVRCISNKKCFKSGLSIVSISSIASDVGNPAKTLYSASKAAMDATVRCLAKELAPKNIRVNSVKPAFVRTNMYEEVMENIGETKDVIQTMKRQYQGVSEPKDIASTILFLLGDESKVITGANIDVSGGYLSS